MRQGAAGSWGCGVGAEGGGWVLGGGGKKRAVNLKPSASWGARWRGVEVGG
ncbi:MAG: hypothetical protein ACKESB_02075 [Candidatus Hodgkinia cicadicola]